MKKKKKTTDEQQRKKGLVQDKMLKDMLLENVTKIYDTLILVMWWFFKIKILTLKWIIYLNTWVKCLVLPYFSNEPGDFSFFENLNNRVK